MERRLLWSLLGASLALNAMYGAIAGVLVPAQIALASPETKEADLAVVMTASSLLTVLVHPAAGAWSDRTRGRWGARSPWIVGGAVATAVALVPLSGASTVWAIGLGWLIVQPLLNVVEAPLDAVAADRVAPLRRPRAGAFYGAGAALGLALGAGLAGFTVADAGRTYLVLGIVFVAAMVTFVVRNPDPVVTVARQPLAWRHAWRHRNFRLVFCGRFVLVLGQQLVQGYLLYVVVAFTGATIEDAGVTTSGLIGLHIASLVVGAVVSARLVGPQRVPWMVAATVVIAVGLTVLVLAPSMVGLVAYSVLSGLGRGLYLTSGIALMIDVLPSSGHHGRDLGILGLATIVPQVLAPALAGVVLTATGTSYRVIVVLALVLVVASLAFITRVRPQDSPPASEQ